MFRRRKSTANQPRRVTPGGRPAAFSYHANRLEQQYNVGRLQPRDQDVRRREKLARYWRQRLGVLVLGVALLGCLLYALHLSPNPQVISLAASSNSVFLQPTATYQRAAAKLFAGSILNGNKITVDADTVARKLQAEFPELADVSVALPLMGHRPIVYIAPATPGLILQSSTSGSFVLSTSGKALLPPDQITGGDLQLPVVTDSSGLSFKPGQTALPASSVSFITVVAQELQQKQIPVATMTLAAQAYELDVQPKGAGYYIKFNMHDNSALAQVGTYLAVRNRLNDQHISPRSYIDVRLIGRAYYK